MRKIIGLACFVALSTVYAAQPKFSFVPQTATVIDLPINGATTVAYEVTNQTNITRTLTTVGTKGITPVTTGSGVCANPFTLSSKQSCILTLLVTGSQIPEHVTRGPEVCAIQGNGNNNPNLFLCSQPSKANSLNITRTRIERPLLSVTPTSFTFTAASQTQVFTVTNNSTTVTAKSIAANFSNTALNGNISQDATDCTSLAPGATCNLSLTTGTNNVSETGVPIQGTNTKKVGVKLTLAIPQTALLSINPTSLILQATNGSPVSEDIVVTNTAQASTATTVRADFTGTALAGNVTATTCGPIDYNQSCTLSFTPGASYVPDTFFNIIADSNGTTSLVGANIAVNAADKINLTVTGSPMTLYANGGFAPDGAKDMTITNTSATETAYNVTAILGSLSDAVEVSTSTCASVAPGAQCKLTFESNTTTAPATNFDIQGGSNTNATAANITVNLAPYAYVANYYTDNISKCKISTSSGALDSCAVAASGNNIDGPDGIAINSSKTYLYVSSHGGPGIQVCQIAPGTGVLTCVNSGVSGIPSNLQGITINPSASYLYLANYGSASISKCPISNAGASLGTCTATGSIANTGQQQIAMHPAGTVYVVTAATVYMCPVTNNPAAGDLGTCTDTGAGTSANDAQAVAFTADGLYAYISGVNFITGCRVETNGSFTQCARLSVASNIIGYGLDIKVNTQGTLAYVATSYNGNSTSYVASCNVANGIVSGCSSTGTGEDNASVTYSHGVGLLQ